MQKCFPCALPWYEYLCWTFCSSVSKNGHRAPSRAEKAGEDCRFEIIQGSSWGDKILYTAVACHYTPSEEKRRVPFLGTSSGFLPQRLEVLCAWAVDDSLGEKHYFPFGIFDDWGICTLPKESPHKRHRFAALAFCIDNLNLLIGRATSSSWSSKSIILALRGSRLPMNRL